MNQKKRGFTLIELLAVIVILAIIALIAVPVIMNIINKANKSAFKDTAYGVISAGELYYAEQLLEPTGMTSDVTITLPDTTNKLQIKGEVPEGKILITTEGKVAIAVQNGRYCVTKGIEDKDVKVTEDVENCNLPSVEENPEEGGSGNTPGGDQGGDTPVSNTLTSLATTSTEVPEKPACLTDGTICAPGTPVAVKVNASEVYNFYVISETEDEITLMMDRNIYAQGNTTEPDVAWINASDYSIANSEEGDNTICEYDACNDEGPITAIAALKERTSGWSNIPEREYTYSDDGANLYESISETMRARMLTLTEAVNIKSANNNIMPSWMYINLYKTGDNNTSAYWLPAAGSRYSDKVYIVFYDGNILFCDIDDNSMYQGLRPVITLTK